MRPIRLISLLTLLAIFGLPVAAEEPAATPQGASVPVETLIERLGSDDFRVREQASRDLVAMGAAARPALERAARKSESLEVRWRAEHLLRRLDRPGDVLGERSAEPWTDLQRRFEELRRAFDDMHRQMDGGWDLDGPWPGSFLPFGRIEAQGLVLERTPGGGVVLRVRRDDSNGEMRREEVYRGEDLEDILKRESSLANHPGMAELKERLAKDELALLPGFPELSWKVTSSSGVEIRQEPGKTTVTLREKDADGKEKVQTYEGKDIEEIKKKHPEIAGKLGVTWSISFDEPTLGASKERLFGPPTSGRAVFGIRYRPLDDALASHLGIERGAGLVIVGVESDSQAEKMGLRAHDVVVSVNGTAVRPSEVAQTLRRAAEDNAALRVEIVRAGKRETLTR